MRLSGTLASPVRITSTYDGSGIRRKQQTASGNMLFLWDGDDLLQAHYTQLSEMLAGVGLLLSQRRGSLSQYYAFDQSGDMRRVSSSTGAGTDTAEYDAFGNVVSSSGSSVLPFRYGGAWGYYTDDDGLLYVRNRYYHPGIGRWISADPVGFLAGDWNLYRYVGNNPVSAVDP